MLPRVYIETTIPSYLTARPSRQVRRQAHQDSTRAWWARRAAFELYVSRLVVQECARGDPTAAADRLAVLAGIPDLAVTPQAVALADDLADRMSLPDGARPDAGHIATAAFHDIEYLLTWNCRHIANPNLWPGIVSVCRAAGFRPPLIRTPDELSPSGDGDG